MECCSPGRGLWCRFLVWRTDCWWSRRCCQWPQHELRGDSLKIWRLSVHRYEPTISFLGQIDLKLLVDWFAYQLQGFIASFGAHDLQSAGIRHAFCEGIMKAPTSNTEESCILSHLNAHSFHALVAFNQLCPHNPYICATYCAPPPCCC